MTPRLSPPPFGVYVPMVTFFNEDESIDYLSISAHINRLLDSSITGLVLLGSNGEATHLTHKERSQLIAHTRDAIQRRNSKTVIIAGCSANSVRECLQYIWEAKAEGADYALLLPPNYWVTAMTTPVIKSFYEQISSRSPLPLIIYNFPSVTSSIDLSSDLISSLAQQTAGNKSKSPIVGAKLTCGNTGKMHRISSTLSPSTFSVFAGKADFLLHGLVAGSAGVISALGNVLPKLHFEIIRLYHAGKLQEAQELQAKLSHGDWMVSKLGVSAVKAVVNKYFGYGSPRARAPLPTVEDEALSGDVGAFLGELVKMEKDVITQSMGQTREARL